MLNMLIFISFLVIIVFFKLLAVEQTLAARK